MAGLRAGAARSCITPKLGTHICGYFSDRIASDIGDDIYAKALVLENGSTALAIVVCDLIALAKEDIDRAKSHASVLTGIPQENILLCCTHTHYGPASVPILGTPRDDHYMEEAMARVADSVKLAQNRLTGAEVGIASVTCPGESFNRRWHMKDGSVHANFEIGYLNPNALRPAGPTDPELLVLVVRDQGRQPIAVLANYSLHYVGGPYPNSISADYFGHFDRALQRLAGCAFVGMMANACSGDINNMDIGRPQPDMPYPTYQAERVANVLAGAAYSAWQGLRGWDYDANPALAVANEVMSFRRRQSSEEELATARRLLKSYTPAPEREIPDAESPQFRQWIYAREALLVAEEPLERQTPIMAMRVGDLGIVGLPGEVFVEYGLQIKAQSPFKDTMCIELANDYIGYCPTDKALAEGSYETAL
ncbi:MAG: hypothetical protein ACUVWR_11535, partial [Anaerolineae bacterium]